MVVMIMPPVVIPMPADVRIPIWIPVRVSIRIPIRTAPVRSAVP